MLIQGNVWSFIGFIKEPGGRIFLCTKKSEKSTKKESSSGPLEKSIQLRDWPNPPKTLLLIKNTLIWRDRSIKIKMAPKQMFFPKFLKNSILKWSALEAPKKIQNQL